MRGSGGRLRNRRTYFLAAVAWILVGLSLGGTPLAGTAPAAAPAKCWVGWRPSQGSLAFSNTGSNQTLMKVRLNWRSEDLTFRTCRERTAFELEMFFGTSNNRHKLKNFTITSTDLPGMYLDSSRERNEVTFGVGNADSLKPNRWYSITYRFAGRLGPNEFMDIAASRGYRLSPCVGGYAICVSGWRNSDKYGPAERIRIFNNVAVKAGRTSSWSYPPRGSLHGKILRHPTDGDAYVLDGAGVRHWIPTGEMYNCLVGNGMPVVNAFASIDQRWVINSFSQGPNASCTPNPAPQPQQPQPQQPQPQQPQPPQSRGYHIEDYFLGGTWARTDPNDGTWYSRNNRPPNGAYWYPNGLGVAVDCARAAAELRGQVGRRPQGDLEHLVPRDRRKVVPVGRQPRGLYERVPWAARLLN